MSTLLADGITYIDTMLAPITPAGVTGVQFISVFLIVYSIIFFLFNQIELLKGNRSARLMVSIVIAYFTATSAFSVLLITKLFPNVGVVTMILLSFLAVIAMVPTKNKQRITFGPILTILGIGMVAFFTWSSMAENINLSGIQLPELSNDEYYGLIFLGIFIAIILLIFMTGKKGNSEKKNRAKALKWLFGVEDDT